MKLSIRTTGMFVAGLMAFCMTAPRAEFIFTPVSGNHEWKDPGSLVGQSFDPAIKRLDQIRSWKMLSGNKLFQTYGQKFDGHGFDAGLAGGLNFGLKGLDTFKGLSYGSGEGGGTHTGDLNKGSNCNNPPGAVPEPTSIALLGAGLVGLGVLRRRLQRT